jgi:hypothetical protein
VKTISSGFSRVMGRSVEHASLGVLVFSALTAACSSSSRRDSIVPESNQEASKERYGEQQLMMDELNQTPAERASVRHHQDSAPTTRPNAGADGKDRD